MILKNNLETSFRSEGRFIFAPMRNYFFVFIVLLIPILSIAQKGKKKELYDTKATQSQERLDGLRKRKLLMDESLTHEIPLRNIGPSVVGGRVTDIEVDPADPTHFFVAFASGGLWVTNNNGISFEPIFDREMVMTIGDFAVDWNQQETIWIGTGEVNSSRSSYSGIGVFKGVKKSEDEWIWEHQGLSDSHHIGKVIIHPTNSNVIYVAVLGALYSVNTEKGLYKTTDAGKTWKRLPVGQDKIGVVDLVLNEKNPEELFVSTWNRDRQAWKFTGHGDGTAVWHSQDGGEKWLNMSSQIGTDLSMFGNTSEEMIGRIGLAFFEEKNGQKHLYAIVDNQELRPPLENKQREVMLKRNDFKDMTKDEFLALDTTLLRRFLRKNSFPEEYSAGRSIDEIRNGKIVPLDFYKYLSNANDDLFNTPIVGAEVYRFDFEKSSWKRTHEDYLDDLVYSYGYYFGLIRIDPTAPKRIYIAGVPLLCSDDEGKSWRGINPDNVHVDHHALWINPNRSGHIINGSDGGVQISYDNGETFVNCNSPVVAQLYAVQVDMATPYNVYGGMQDNGVWYGSSKSRNDVSWHKSGHHEFYELYGGDGMQIMVDNRDNFTLYTGSQFGDYCRTSSDGKLYHPFNIRHKLGEEPYRWNWQTPILLSPHNQDIVYIGSNRLHRSTDQGENFSTISEDLTKNIHSEESIPYGTITCLDESIFQFGLLVVGTDDGNVMLSSDNGYHWKAINDGLPSQLWVSRVIFSKHVENRIYVTMSGYRFDHFKPYVFVSDDLGKTWRFISNGLPAEPVNVIREDHFDHNILYVGTDNGVYYTLDEGIKWMYLTEKLPQVAVHDLVIQTRENELVIGTHGRGIWIADIQSLHLLNQAKDSSLAVFFVDAIKYDINWGNGNKWMMIEEPKMNIPVYTNGATKVTVDVIYDNEKITQLEFTKSPKSLSHLEWDLVISEERAKFLESKWNEGKQEDDRISLRKSTSGKFYLLPGSYKLVVTAGDSVSVKNFEVLE